MFENSGAEEAGIRETLSDDDWTIYPGDIVVEIAGRPIRTESDMARALTGKKPGEEVSVVVIRENQTVKLKLKLQAAKK